MSQPLVWEKRKSFSTGNNFCGAEERAEILAWLSPLEPWVRHHDIRAHRVENVGDWLLRTEEYRNWFDGIHGGESHNSALFCQGEPGVGKTYISSLVIDTLGDWARGRNAVVACFYIDFAAHKEQSPTSVLSSLLKQVVGELEEIPARIVQVFQDQKRLIGNRKLGLGGVVEMLQDISSERPTFICIDALDEYLAEYRAKLLDLLEQILHKSPSARVFLTGRLQVRGEVEERLAGRVTALSITPTEGDLITFLRAKLQEGTTPDTIDESLEEDIIKNIPEKVSETFLFAALSIKAILLETTPRRRREKLGTMTNGLDAAYDALIGQIKAQEGGRERLGIATLMWILHWERPLSVDEICQALAAGMGSIDMNINNIPSIGTVLGCCRGLVAVDKGSSTIRLIHFTLKEYLSRHAELFDKPHSEIAEICLAYLNSQDIKDLPASLSPDLRGPAFLEYSSLYWGTHMRIELSDRSRCLALNLLDQYDNHISAQLLWKSTAEWYFLSRKPFSALHCISYLGIAEVAADLIRTKRWDVNQRDSAGLTPLMWAAKYGREEVVKLLLQQKRTQPDILDERYGRTALSWAAESGHEGVVRLFLGRQFVNPGSIGRRWEKTPRVMSVLFGRKYVNPDMLDRGDQTPLLWAARNRRDGAVKLLLERKDVSPNRPGTRGHTLLAWAAREGHEGIVKLLLERKDVNPDKPDDCGETPLSWAAGYGRDGIVKLLLGREDVNPDRPDNHGRTPLLVSACNGRDRIVKLLLEREDVSPDRPDNSGQTPLSWAARNRRDGIPAVKLLLEREDVGPDRMDNNGQTSLSWAARNGCDEAVKLLLGCEDVYPDRPDTSGQTPLLWAAFNGHDGAAKLLLEREDVSPDTPDNGGRTPLLLATMYRHCGVVNLLQARKAATPRVV